MKISGTYAMAEWNEKPVIDAEIPNKLTRVLVHGTLSGGMIGNAETRYLLAYVHEHGGHFSGYCRFVGEIGGRSGSFLIEEHGTSDATSATSKWTILPGSGTGDLKGATGRGGFRAEHGLNVDYNLDITFAA